MASNGYGVRFTEDNYLTKSEISKELGTSLVDSFWSDVLKYRSTFFRYLTLKSIEKRQLMICYCETVGNNIARIDDKIYALSQDYLKLNRDNGDMTRFEDLCFIKSLKYIAKKHDIDVTDIYLRSLVLGDLHDLQYNQKILRKYLKALRFVKENYGKDISVDYLAELYSVFTENPELTSFYRSEEDNNPYNRVLIDRIYTSAPVALIEGLMNSLFTFLNNTTLNCIAKAIIAYYFVTYVRPFPKENEEIALLLMKGILASERVGEFASLLPLEVILNINSDVFNKVCVEVQKTSDLTYVVNLILKEIPQAFTDIANIKANQTVEILRRDVYLEDKEETPTPTYVYEDKKEKDVQSVTPIVVETPKVNKEIKQEPASEQPVQEIAFSYIPQSLDEKQAQRLEEHLLEVDPAIKRGEAKFYARHCTMHMNYTIQQYKKAIGCVYETARTSMEHLVELQYYRKDKVKNKFVYTPIKR